MKTNSWLSFALFIGLAFLAGAIGSYYTFPSIPTWYASLVHPSWTPPNWVFGPVWTTLYVLMGASAALVWNSRKSGRAWPLALYLFQLVVNAAWSIVFFSFHETAIALIIVKSLWLMVVALALLSWRYSKLAAYLLIPYILWVSYAASLNLGITLLNP